MAARWCRFREGYLWAALLLAVAAQHICTASLQPELAFSSSEVDDLVSLKSMAAYMYPT